MTKTRAAKIVEAKIKEVFVFGFIFLYFVSHPSRSTSPHAISPLIEIRRRGKQLLNLVRPEEQSVCRFSTYRHIRDHSIQVGKKANFNLLTLGNSEKSSFQIRTLP